MNENISLTDKLEPNNRELGWQYVALDADYALGVSYTSDSVPIVSGALTENRPCFSMAAPIQ